MFFSESQSAEFRRLDKNIKCLNQIRLNLERLTDVTQEEEDSDDEEDIDEEEDSE